MTVDLARPGFSTTVQALRLRTWQLGAGQPTLVLDQFRDEDFQLVVDDRSDVHINSRDGRFYLGWFPHGRSGPDGEGWKVAVAGTAEVPGYHVAFATETPAEIVAAAVATVLAASHPARPSASGATT
ncbi:DUF317 domain-containing protein [Streptomyces sp. H27-D2]|uniref:DUF317 domain-containing protein n=1 Tax=Streptomyces sp. H27-D2 TaxID=3046304 RepID=UPI002DB94BD0|nr:DUF317 domain-containing protein [Streptomyces sp. H27-D2]MEC4019687.1 DUF317 domain-containing protein [Streptomyces sp. H27-D2]